MFDEDNYLCEIEDLKSQICELEDGIQYLNDEIESLYQQLKDKDYTIERLQDELWEAQHSVY